MRAAPPRALVTQAGNGGARGAGRWHVARVTEAMMTPAQPPAQSPWLLTWEELHNTPSQIIDGFSYEKLESYRAATADFMQQVGVALRLCVRFGARCAREPRPGWPRRSRARARAARGARVLRPARRARAARAWPRAARSPQLSVSTSIVFMHRFYARKSFKEYDRFILSCTCLLLGGKVEETPKKLKDVLTEAYRVRHNCKLSEVPDADSREFWKMKEQVLVSERILLQTLGFELQIEHPYRPLLAYVKAIQATRDFAQLAWNFVNDSYRTVICLQYTYDTVAAAAVLLAAAYKGVKVCVRAGARPTRVPRPAAHAARRGGLGTGAEPSTRHPPLCGRAGSRRPADAPEPALEPVVHHLQRRAGGGCVRVRQHDLRSVRARAEQGGRPPARRGGGLRRQGRGAARVPSRAQGGRGREGAPPAARRLLARLDTGRATRRRRRGERRQTRAPSRTHQRQPSGPAAARRRATQRRCGGGAGVDTASLLGRAPERGGQGGRGTDSRERAGCSSATSAFRRRGEERVASRTGPPVSRGAVCSQRQRPVADSQCARRRLGQRLDAAA